MKNVIRGVVERNHLSILDGTLSLTKITHHTVYKTAITKWFEKIDCNENGIDS